MEESTGSCWGGLELLSDVSQFNCGSCPCCLITRTSMASTRCLRWKWHGVVASSQTRGFGRDSLSPFHPKVFVYVKTVVSLYPPITPRWEDKDTHTLGMGTGLSQSQIIPGIKRLEHTDKRLDCIPAFLCLKFAPLDFRNLRIVSEVTDHMI